MRRLLGAATLLPLLALASCVERTLEIRSDPPGARVTLDGAFIGTTGKDPLIVPFHHYGTREIVIEKKGYLPAVQKAKISPPIYQVFPLDFVFECLFPFTLRDQNAISAVLEKAPAPAGPDRRDLEKRFLSRAESMRKKLARGAPHPD